MKNKGQNLTEISIILGLVVLVGIISLTFLGDSVSDLLSNSVHKSKNYKPFDWGSTTSSSSSSTSTTSTTASPSNPIKNCIDNSCSIDFGSVQLTGLPEDFNYFIETSGASGGTDMLSDLLSQIAQQMEEQGLTEESDQIKKLSSIGHNMAVFQKSVEELINTCNYDAACIKAHQDDIVPMPAGYDDTYFPYPDAINYEGMALSGIVGGMRNNINTLMFTSALNKGYPSANFVDTLDTIVDNKNISQDTRNLINELSWDIGVIGEDFQNNVEFLSPSFFGDINKLADNTFFDPLTSKETKYNSPSDAVDNFSNYNASKVTHFDSALICAAGQNKDSGTKCH